VAKKKASTAPAPPEGSEPSESLEGVLGRLPASVEDLTPEHLPDLALALQLRGGDAPAGASAAIFQGLVFRMLLRAAIRVATESGALNALGEQLIDALRVQLGRVLDADDVEQIVDLIRGMFNGPGFLPAP
jgi:hypothetical protein